MARSKSAEAVAFTCFGGVSLPSRRGIQLEFVAVNGV
jgi:hypothetical protein